MKIKTKGVIFSFVKNWLNVLSTTFNSSGLKSFENPLTEGTAYKVTLQQTTEGSVSDYIKLEAKTTKDGTTTYKQLYIGSSASISYPYEMNAVAEGNVVGIQVTITSNGGASGVIGTYYLKVDKHL